ncbi:MAG: hypothetical protein WC809_19685 [Sinimarinibacterium sp.]|jgi:hypothetical protein
MGEMKLFANQALKAHRIFLQEVLVEVMPILASGTASETRLIAGLEVYWEACFARRDTRCAVHAATKNTPFEQVIEPMGKPFEVMVRAELLPTLGAHAAALATFVYDTARAITIDEALSGERASERRRALIEQISASAPLAELKAA